MAQSIGGGGGNGGINISGGIQSGNNSKASSLVFGLGGFGGAGNISGTVTADSERAQCMVDGTRSIGVLAQSIAGGGGNGGLNVSGNLAIGKGYSAAVGIGGDGGTGANAGAVSLTSDGAIFVDGRAIVRSGRYVGRSAEARSARSSRAGERHPRAVRRWRRR